LVSQDRRHLVVTPCQLYTHTVKVLCEDVVYKFKIVGTWSQWDINYQLYR
jgi:hypothetical protein